MTNPQTIDIHPLTSRVLVLFEEFSGKYPRRSGGEKAAADYVAGFADDLEKNGVVSKVIRQYGETGTGRKIHNVIVKKPAQGCLNSKPILLQAHIDMVCEPNNSKEHNFDKEPILTYEEKDEHGIVWIKATLKEEGGTETVNTTLGADDGIGVACILAILEAKPDQMSHPPIWAVFTSDEEAEMSGAEYLNQELIDDDVRRMINIDTEQEGIFFNGCAGGLNITSNIKLELTKPNCEVTRFEFSVTGLIGGHSGLMIGERRANANRLIGRALDTLQEKLGDKVLVSSIKGGEYPNAIPASCTAQIAVHKGYEDELKAIADELQNVFKAEYKGTDADPGRYGGDDINKGLHLNLDKLGDGDETVYMTGDTLNKVITMLTAPLNGVIDMHTEFPKPDGDDLVETSCNMGKVYPAKTENGEAALEVVCFARSCFESKKHMVARQIIRVAECVGATVKTSSDFPAWAPNSDSVIRRAMEAIYIKEFGKNAQTKSIHAGLECGYFAKAFPGLDCIAIGPTILGAHTTEERLEKDTVNLIVRLLVRALAEIDEIDLDKAPAFTTNAKHDHKKHLNCMCMR